MPILASTKCFYLADNGNKATDQKTRAPVIAASMHCSSFCEFCSISTTAVLQLYTMAEWVYYCMQGCMYYTPSSSVLYCVNPFPLTAPAFGPFLHPTRLIYCTLQCSEFTHASSSMGPNIKVYCPRLFLLLQLSKGG